MRFVIRHEGKNRLRVHMKQSRMMYLPYPIRFALATIESCKYICKGIKVLCQRKIEVPVLDATAISVSMLRGDIGTAGSVMFLLDIGEILEE